MKIFDVKHLAEADKATIEKQGITSEQLMERAATKVYEEIHKRLQNNPLPIKIFCGIGNNGGDGLVLGRLLFQEGYNVKVYVVNFTNKRSGEFLINYNRFQEVSKKWPILLKGEDDFPEISSADFIIDAIFGIGLNRPAEGWVANLIKRVNRSGAFVLSVDLPSGLSSNITPDKEDAIIKSSFTLTFQAPKLVFFLPQTAAYVGDFQVLDIGLDREYLASAPAVAQLISKTEAITLYKPRKQFSHKGNYGHSLIIGGSHGKIGSISLTATASLKAGAGLVTIYSPSCGYNILQTVLPEAMVLTDNGERELEDIKFGIQPTVICFGMGAGTSEKTMKTYENLLQKTKIPMVIDADGLNMLSKNKNLVDLVPKGSVLTPHPKELARLIGEWKDDFHKIEKAKEYSKEHELILVLKDAHTLTISGEDIYVNNSGNPGMATAGSGDVLAGIITGLISQKYEPLIAAVLGTYLHGKAGDIAAASLGYESMTAGDLTQFLGASFLDLFKNDNKTGTN